MLLVTSRSSLFHKNQPTKKKQKKEFFNFFAVKLCVLLKTEAIKKVTKEKDCKIPEKSIAVGCFVKVPLVKYA